MVFHKCFWLFDALITFIFIIVIVTHWGLSSFFLSFQVHFFELIFSDNQGNGTVSNVLAIIMWPLSGSRGVVACCVTHIWRTTFLFSWCWMSLFYFVSRPLDLCKTNKSPGDNETKKRNKKLKMSSTLTWLLDWNGDLANKAKALTKGERFRQWETLNQLLFHVSLTHKPTHASRVAHMTVKDKDSTVVFLSGMERKKKK